MLSIEADFPLLQRKMDDKVISYLDSAATSLKPLCVLRSEQHFANTYLSNVHRAHNALADEASYHFEAARRQIAGWIHADPDLTIMTPNSTYGLAIVANGIGLTKEDHVLCGKNNHHSNLLPWMSCATVHYIEGDPLLPLDPDEMIAGIKKYRPRVIAFSWVSNVNGAMSDAKALCKIARDYGVISVIDAAQAAAHVDINVASLDCDFLVFSGHKMLGPMGTGVLYGKRHLMDECKPLVVGGGTVDRVSHDRYTLKSLPYKFEPGTPNISGVIGLGAAIGYAEQIGREKMMTHEYHLKQAMLERFSSIKNIQVLSGGDKNIALLSVIPTNALHSDVVCRILSDTYKIMTRSGFHCAHPLFDLLNIKSGAVRFSAYLYNSVEEIYAAGNALEKIVRHT